MSAYDPSTTCPLDSRLRQRAAKANYDGLWREASIALALLHEHHQLCPTCQGVPLAEQLFKAKVTVADGNAPR